MTKKYETPVFYAALIAGAVLTITGFGAVFHYLPQGAVTGPAVDLAATVDGAPVTSGTVDRLLSAGLDRANAMDRAINQRVAANLAQAQYANEVTQRMAEVTTEVAASVYLSKSLEKASGAITDDALQSRYAAEVKAADFNGYRLRFALYPDQDTASSAMKAMQQGNADALKQLQPLSTDAAGNAGFVGRDGIPYNLGVLVAKLKAGDYLGPTMVRNGVLVMRLESIKEGVRPEFSAVKDALRQRMADEQVVRQIAEARKVSKIELK